MLQTLAKTASYRLFRLRNRPHALPMNVTLSVTYHCNSRCKTCNVYTRKVEEFSLEEWQKVFQGLGTAPFWVTISGGEPFLRADLVDIVCAMYDSCRPAVINIPTNGLLSKRIPGFVEAIAAHCRDAQIVINLSLDEIGELHDLIRGVPGNYQRALETFTALKNIDRPNLTRGIHTVVSTFNVDRIPQIYQHIRTLNPDSYVTEIAEERGELQTIDFGATPAKADYMKVADFLINTLKKERFAKIGRITRAFRIEYYKLVKKTLEQSRQVIPCYAGFASAQIAPDGDVWMCCTKAESIGNLRDMDYEFKTLWSSQKAAMLRAKIKRHECHCPLANASYTNILHNFRALSRVGWNLLAIH